MKYFDPVNYPKKSVNKVTIYGSVLTLTGSSGTANITINGIVNTTIATFSSTLTATAANWVTANYAFYLARGFKVSSAVAVITIVPANDWDTVNRINASVSSAVSGNLTGTYTGVFEADLGKAKTWQVTLTCNTLIKYPRNAVDGDKIRLELKNNSTYTVTWSTLGVYFVGGTEPTVTTNGITTVEGTVNVGFFPRTDVITLTGTTGTANVTAGRLTKLATFGDSLSDTADDFVTSWATAYAAIGITVTASSGTLIFTPATKDANYYPIPTIVGADTDLAGTVVQNHEGRVQMGTVYLDVKQ